MDVDELESFFQTAWRATTKECIGKIQDAEDKRTVRSFRNYNDIKQHLVEEPDEPWSESVLRELSLILPRLCELRDFSRDFSERLGPNLDASIFWGLMGVLLTVAAHQEDIGAPKRITQMLKKLSRDVGFLRSHLHTNATLSNHEKEAVFDTFIAVVRFFSEATRFLRNEDHLLACESSGQDPWKTIEETFHSSCHDIEEALKTIHKPSPSMDRRGSEMNWIFSAMCLTPHSWRDDATLPCIIMPPPRNKLFDREDVVDQIEAHFKTPSSQAFRSVALHGIGGVGKTHVAMRYAQDQHRKRLVNAVLWVEGETELKIKQSFSNIAKSLQLPRYTPNNYDDNRLLVLGWLQQTNEEAKWLMIYDNVEKYEDLVAHWPNMTAGGHAIITTRNTALAFEPAETGIEITPWDRETGSKFLLHLLSGHISSDILEHQSQSALELSDRLSGHALGLAKMGGVIHRRCWTIEQLLQEYDQQPELRNGISPVWQLSFQNLTPNGKSLLSVFSFCSADMIPQSLFEPSNYQCLVDDMPWCGNAELLSLAMEELQTLSVIRKDREKVSWAQRVALLHMPGHQSSYSRPVDLSSRGDSLGIAIFLAEPWISKFENDPVAQVFVCNTEARWAGAKSIIELDPGGNLAYEFHSARSRNLATVELDNGIAGGLGSKSYQPPNDGSMPRIQLSPDWFSLLNPVLPEGFNLGFGPYTDRNVVNQTAFEHLVQLIYIPNDASTSVFENLINMNIADGLSRSGLIANFNSSRLLEAWPFGNWDVRTDELAKTLVMRGEPKESFPEPEILKGHSTRMVMRAKYTGYTMYSDSGFAYLCCTALLLHALLAGIHTILTVYYKNTSGVWNTVLEIVALSHKSSPSRNGLLDNTSGGIRSFKTVKLIAWVQAQPGPEMADGGGDLELRLKEEDTEQRMDASKPVPGLLYGAHK